MLKNIIEQYVRKTKNPSFQFDEDLDSLILMEFMFRNAIAFIRFLILGKGKWPGFWFSGVKTFNRKKIAIGKNVRLGIGVSISALGRGGVSIGDNVNVGSYSQIILSTSLSNFGEYIKISDNVGIGEFSYIGGAGGTEIGSGTIIGQYFSVHPENHLFSDPNVEIRHQGVERNGIKIGKNCWIGSKVTVLDGVDLGDNCVVAAGSVVTKSFGDHVVLGGVPAKVIKELN